MFVKEVNLLYYIHIYIYIVECVNRLHACLHEALNLFIGISHKHIFVNRMQIVFFCLTDKRQFSYQNAIIERLTTRSA